jgi:hypothetical protein
MVDATKRICEARANLRAAKRDALAALHAYVAEESARNVPRGKYAGGMRSANRAHAETRLPADMKALLDIEIGPGGGINSSRR